MILRRAQQDKNGEICLLTMCYPVMFDLLYHVVNVLSVMPDILSQVVNVLSRHA